MASTKFKKHIAQMILFSVMTMPVIAQAAGNSVIANDTMPTLDDVVAGISQSDIFQQGVIMDVQQRDTNAIIKWKDFSIGANSTVNFTKQGGGSFNTLNYVTGGDMSYIYGKLNAADGNIFLVNPNGVQIGNSAQINVGSLHVANKKIDNIDSWNNSDFAGQLNNIHEMTNAELMSLGHITAKSLTFEGSRVILDMDRIQGASNINIVGSADVVKDNDIVLGASDINNATKATVKINGEEQSADALEKNFTYQWIKDGNDLGKINDNLSGNYALRYAIDLTGQEQAPIGASADKAFKGKFDGLNNNIFGLTINNSSNDKGSATGLFGYTDGATIGNVKLIAGNEGVSINGGSSDTGALIGHAKNTKVNNVTNTLQVAGSKNVGGLIGYAENSTLRDLINTGAVSGKENVGGIVGSMNGGTLGVGESAQTHNLGRISGLDDEANNYYSHNIGGLVGAAESAVIGAVTQNGSEYEDSGDALLNAAVVSGGYNVGGIVGSASNTVIQNARNESRIIATGYTNEDYFFRTDYAGWVDGKQYNNVTKADGTTITGMHKESVRMANVGGIAGNTSNGSTVKSVENRADVESKMVKATTNASDNPSGFDHYGAGNVGGIVGRAQDTDIKQATNFESDIRGAMNVGGIAGYFTSSENAAKQYRISEAANDGGNILASGGITDTGNFSREIIGINKASEQYITGNIGGIAGLLFGDNVYIDNAVNRGSVHTEGVDIDTRDNADIPLTATAANIGGIVGKIDRSKANLTNDERLNLIKNNTSEAVVSSSHNTGAVRGYANIGGIAGFAYNGSIASSYNIGKINTTRSEAVGTAPINLGGIVGDSTEGTNAYIVLYDVYNTGELGDKSFTYFGRHVGGVVGRLNGVIEKAYNTGDIYNGSNVVGGIAGYMYSGNMKNVFNTGNITVYNQNDKDTDTSQVGGLIGALDIEGGKADGNITNIINAYNLGTLRSFRSSTNKRNTVGGLIGKVAYWHESAADPNKFKLIITNAYTLGELFGSHDGSGGNDGIAQILGDSFRIGCDDNNNSSPNIIATNVYYLAPTNSAFQDKSAWSQFGSKVITKEDFFNKQGEIGFDFVNSSEGKFNFAEDQNPDDTWRIYENGLPILNAFLPDANKYFGDNWGTLKDNGLDDVQYGTAYNPLLTIVKAHQDQKYDWKKLGIKDDGSLSVIGAGLTLDNVSANHNNLFGGTIYTDGALVINADDAADKISLGSAAQLIGSSVEVNSKGNLLIRGKVQATGNKITNKTYSEDEEQKLGNVTLNVGSLDVYGEVSTAKAGETTAIDGLAGAGDYTKAYDNLDTIKDYTKQLTPTGKKYTYTTNASERNGDLSIMTTNGAANIRYGNQEKGKLDVAGDMNIVSADNIFIDADISVGGRIGLDAAGGEAVLDLTNVGAMSKANDGKLHNVQAIHDFLDKHTTQATGIIGSDNTDVKIAFDVWNPDGYFESDSTDTTGVLDYKQYDIVTGEGEAQTTTRLSDKLQKLYVESAGMKYGGEDGGSIKDVVYAWISDADQLNGIQHYAEKGQYKNEVLSYNFMLKNDIDASELENYKSIASGDQAFTGRFDGRNQRIIGLKADNGLFTNNAGTIENLKIYSSVIKAADNGTAGAIAANNIMQSSNNLIDHGFIKNITGLGNTIVGAEGSTIGGLVGQNTSTIRDVSDESTVLADNNTTAGGIVGVNGIANIEFSLGEFGSFWMSMGGSIDNAQSNSAVTTKNLAAGEYAENLGGIAGKNISEGYGSMENVSAHGVTGKSGSATTVGGIVGTNNGIIKNAYNESLVHGKNNLGGIAGINAVDNYTTGDGSQEETRASIEYVTNASEIIGDNGSENVGGLIGSQQTGASLEIGRNTGVIEGTTNVGGFVGYNDTDTILNNLENAPQASITGVTNVGGVAGYNKGYIFGSLDLVNEGKITGVENVGGVVGVNEGKIEGISANVNLYVKAGASDAKYFGGIAGKNSGTIVDAKNKSTINAAEADYVGGIVGYNTATGVLTGLGNESSGTVIGKNYVGGVIGLNEAKITHWREEKTDYKGHWVDYDGNILPDDTDVEEKYFIYDLDENDNVIVKDQYTIYHKTKIENNGTVIAKEGGAGGLIGVNKGEIEDSTWINNGKVYGTGYGGTGGIFGVNEGKVHHADLINNIGAEVSGVKNVGGLVGINRGSITGGRMTLQTEVKQYVIKDTVAQENPNTNAIYLKDADYYATMIYNNGTITAGTITAAAGENIGGLIGLNEGTLSAAYNTGAIAADTSTNVGGIVGSNSTNGKIDQVFNTVAVRSGSAGNYSWAAGSVNGGENVGGIVGSNSGTLTNAYNTTAVNGTTNAGSIAGKNSGMIKDTYDSNAKEGQQLVGDSTLASDSYIYKADSAAAKKKNNYNGFAFGSTWKIYEGSSSPLLKIFLTKVGYDASKDTQKLRYNGSSQHPDINQLISDGALTDLSGKSFGAYNNADTSLINNDTASNVNAGFYTDYLWSLQLGYDGKDGSPNNLGYDLPEVDYMIKPAENSEIRPTDNYWYSTAPWDSNGSSRERKAELAYVDGGIRLAAEDQ